MQSDNPITVFTNLSNLLITTKKSYTDETFPANAKSLYLNPQYSITNPKSDYQLWKDLKFTRILHITSPGNENPMMFKSPLNSNHIIAGNHGNRYFASAIASLSDYPLLIPRLFHNITLNQEGLYGIWLCDNGEWRLIDLDDYIVTTLDQDNRVIPAFTRSTQGDFWVSLLEKAYAKIHGSYENIKEGFTEHVLRELTGVPYKTLFNEQDSHKVWSFLKYSIDNRFITVATHKNEKDDPGAHAYSILDLKEVYTSKGKQRLVCIKNPWKTFKWDGDWSKSSNKWNYDVRKACNYDPNDDTKLWFSITDFVNTFEDISTLEIRDNYYYQSVKVDHAENHSNYTILRLFVTKPSNINITVVQKDERDFNGLKDSNYTYSFGRIIIGKVTDKGLIYQYGVGDQAREMQCGGIFEQGIYIVTVEVHWVQNNYKKLNIGFYSESEIMVENVPNVDLLKIQKNLIKSAIEISPPADQNYDDYSSVEEPNASRTSGVLHGILYFYYTNQAELNTKITETVDLQGKNFKICPPFTQNNSFFVSVGPGGSILVLIKVMSINHSYQLSFNFSAQLTDGDEPDTVYDFNSDKYEYIDIPSNKQTIPINDHYNKYLREKNLDQETIINSNKSVRLTNQTIINPKLEEKAEKVEKVKKTAIAHEKLTVIPRDSVLKGLEDEYKPSYSFVTEDEHSNSFKSFEKSTDPLNETIEKPINSYPEISMAFGQIFSKKIPFTNYSNEVKTIQVESDNPDVIFVKNKEFVVGPNDIADLRLRFIAPIDEGIKQIKVTITDMKTQKIEEILLFTINSSGAYKIENY